MAGHDLVLAVGSIFDLRRERRSGTCTAYRHSQLALTAAHCVEELDASEVEVQFVAGAGRCGAVEIVRHPSADLALLRLAGGAALAGVEPALAIARLADSGPAFAGIGSAEGAASIAEAGQRVFEGRVRRTFTDPADGHLYADLSVPALDGYSGGPLVAATSPHPLLALITANRRGRFARRGNLGHGIALLVGELAEWIDAHAAGQPAPEAAAG